MKDNTLYSAFNHWEELSSTTKEIMDEEAAKREFELRAQEAEEKGEKRGEERGIKKGQKKSQEAIARKLIAEELDLDLIRRM
ncbi:hypothetical protein EPH95_05865 [Salicibibacter halophilus]|uniref:Rpn family recombination-promoting nuclease/putative transposase n=2 Tax=Salicibibacter halophilus TaxID=2502791 RepID=A0A514LFZ4_9BACI|nr:hypothetical protein EPH95_05865 [Salicibibacter halophilus]